MLFPIFLLTTTLAAGCTFATPTAALEKRCLNCPWIGYYNDGGMECQGGNRTNIWLEINNQELKEFKRPANTAVGVHFGTGIGFAQHISGFTDAEVSLLSFLSLPAVTRLTRVIVRRARRERTILRTTCIASSSATMTRVIGLGRFRG